MELTMWASFRLAVLILLLSASSAFAQLTKPGGGFVPPTKGGTGTGGAGDITEVLAGNGLTGGGPSGSVTLNVAVGAGLSVTADQVSLDLAGASCPAGSFVSAISSTGTGTCTTFSSQNLLTTSNVSGTSGRSARFSGSNTIGNGAFTDDGTNATINGVLAIVDTTAGSDSLEVIHTLTGATTSVQALHATQSGTMNTTSSALNSTGIRGEATTSRSAGSNTLTNVGVEGIANGSPVSNYGARFIVSGSTGTDNRAIQVEATANGGGQPLYGIHVLTNGTNTGTNFGIKVGAVNGNINRAFEASDGNVLFNTQSGTTTIGGATTVYGATFTLGLGGSANTKLVEKHNGTMSATSCGTGPTVTGGDPAFTVVTGTGATACTVSFFSAFQNAPTCTVTARSGGNQAGLTYTTSTTALTMSAAAASASYDVICVGH